MCDCCPEQLDFVPVEDIQGPLISYHFDSEQED